MKKKRKISLFCGSFWFSVVTLVTSGKTNFNIFCFLLLLLEYRYSPIGRPRLSERAPLHYADVGDIQQGLGLPVKASL